ncbi:hypothetical protein DFH28DRAFT_922473 [Melampsora americana]|nr:hypothetical protein DFH28DRAFT_922473 [Melampsora americana]
MAPPEWRQHRLIGFHQDTLRANASTGDDINQEDSENSCCSWIIRQSTLSKTTPPQMVFYHQARRCKWHQQHGGPKGPSLYTPSAHGPNPIAFMTPSPGSLPTLSNPNLSASDQSLSCATFNLSEFSDFEVQKVADQNLILKSTYNDSALLVLDELEYVLPIREHVLFNPEDNLSGFQLEKMHDLHLKFGIYSQEGVKPTRGLTALSFLANQNIPPTFSKERSSKLILPIICF